jgi:hypothetical protein
VSFSESLVHRGGQVDIHCDGQSGIRLRAKKFLQKSKGGGDAAALSNEVWSGARLLSLSHLFERRGVRRTVRGIALIIRIKGQQPSATAVLARFVHLIVPYPLTSRL